jgi:hypothetical protein
MEIQIQKAPTNLAVHQGFCGFGGSSPPPHLQYSKFPGACQGVWGRIFEEFFPLVIHPAL